MPIGFDNQDSDYIKGGTDNTLIGNVADQQKVDDVARTAAVYGELTVGTSPVELKVGVSALANRKYITMRPKDSGIYFGYNNSVTITSGTKLFKDEFLILPIGVSVWLIADASNKKISIGELS